MLKTTQTGKSSFTLSLVLSGLLMLLYAMPKAAAQEPDRRLVEDQADPDEHDARGHKPGRVNLARLLFLLAVLFLLLFDPVFPFFLMMLMMLLVVVHAFLLFRR